MRLTIKLKVLAVLTITERVINDAWFVLCVDDWVISVYVCCGVTIPPWKLTTNTSAAEDELKVGNHPSNGS